MKIVSSLITVAAISLIWQANAALPHPDDINKQVEHLALLAIVPESQASNVAVTSGNWSNPATWGGNLPTNFSTVLVPTGVTVTVDTTLAARIRWIRVNGILSFANNVDTMLKVDTLVVDPAGKLFIGTDTQPISANVTAKLIFADFGDIDRSWDPAGLSRGLISHAPTRICGAPTTPYGILSQPARRGDMTLTLRTAPQNWKVGGRLVLPSVGFIYEGSDGLFNDDDEELTVTAVSGNVITVNRPLKYNHLSPAGSATIPIPLAYLDRNVIIQSENPAVPRRGHVMFMHNYDIQVSDALFEQCGRTDASRLVTDPVLDAQGRLVPGTSGNDRGRYALHFHRTIPDPTKPARVTRVAIVNSPKFGVVNHDSNVICEDSVAYDVAGSAFFTEVGSEIGAFRRNLAIRTIRGGGTRGDVERFAADGSGLGGPALLGGPDFGSNGNGFWFQGAGIDVVDNMAFKTKDMAFVYDTVGFAPQNTPTMFLRSNLTPDNPYFDPNKTGATLQVNQVPISKFSGNIAAGAFTGFMLRKNDPVGKASVLENSKAVNISSYGIDAEYGGPKTFKNLIIRGGTLRSDGSLSGWLNGLGEMGFVSNQNSIGLTIQNCEFSNFMRGARFVIRGQNYISDTIFDNIFNLRIENGIEVPTPLIVERVSFRHNVTPLQTSDPELNTYRDLSMYAPHTAYSPVTVNGVAMQFPAQGTAALHNLPSQALNPGPTDWSYPTTSATGIPPVDPPAPTGPAPLISTAVSRKTHGSAGTFDVPLALAGTAGVECRRSGSTLTLVLTFDQNVTSGGASVTTGTGSVTGSTFSGNQMTVSLVGVADRQTLGVSVTNVVGANGGVLGNSTIPVAMLFADSDRTRAVNVGDIARTRLRASTGLVDASTFGSDVNADGVINILDISLTRVNSGASVQ